MTSPVPPRDRTDQPWRSEGAPPPPPPRRKMPGGWGGLLLTALAVYLITNVVLSFFNGRNEPTIAYTEFSKQVTAGNVSKIYSKGDAIQGQLRKEAKVPGSDRKYTKFVTQRPAFADDNLWAELIKDDVTVTAEPVVQQRSFLANLLISLAPILLLVLLWVFIARRMSGGFGGSRRTGPQGPAQTGRTGGRQTHHFRGRGRDRRGRGRTQRCRRLPEEPAGVPEDGRPDARGSAAQPARPAPARRCSRGPSRARPGCRSSRPPPPSSSR